MEHYKNMGVHFVKRSNNSLSFRACNHKRLKFEIQLLKKFFLINFHLYIVQTDLTI